MIPEALRRRLIGKGVYRCLVSTTPQLSRQGAYLGVRVEAVTVPAGMATLVTTDQDALLGVPTRQPQTPEPTIPQTNIPTTIPPHVDPTHAGTNLMLSNSDPAHYSGMLYFQSVPHADEITNGFSFR